MVSPPEIKIALHKTGAMVRNTKTALSGGFDLTQ